MNRQVVFTDRAAPVLVEGRIQYPALLRLRMTRESAAEHIVELAQALAGAGGEFEFLFAGDAVLPTEEAAPAESPQGPTIGRWEAPAEVPAEERGTGK